MDRVQLTQGRRATNQVIVHCSENLIDPCGGSGAI